MHLRGHLAGRDPALLEAVVVLGAVGVLHGASMLFSPSGYASDAWGPAKGLLPLPVWGALFLLIGAMILIAALAPVPAQLVAFLLAAKASLVSALAMCFVGYAVGHAGRGQWSAITLGGFAALQIVVALRTGRLR